MNLKSMSTKKLRKLLAVSGRRSPFRHQLVGLIVTELLKRRVNMFADLKDVEIEGIDHNDAPKYVDAYIVSANFPDGTPLTEEQLDEVNSDGDLIYMYVYKYLY